MARELKGKERESNYITNRHQGKEAFLVLSQRSDLYEKNKLVEGGPLH